MGSEVIETVKVLIVGSGPAGYTAAIYTSRANLNPVLYQGIQPGGQLTTTTDVENFPGFSEGVLGDSLMNEMSEQALRLGADIRFGMITKVDLSERPFKVEIDDGENNILAESIIIATGASAKWLGLPNEQTISGVSACAVCDGYFHKGKEVAIVGAGDSACEEAIYLSKMCTTVHMLIRKDKMRASKIMQERVMNTPNIKLYWNSEVSEIMGNGKLELITCRNIKTKVLSVLHVSGLFIAIGHTPNTKLFKGQIKLDNEGYIVTEPGTSKTNIEGVFAAGDVQDKHYRQAITAAGSGCIAALDCERFLSTQ